jgi:hypothetical protein
MVGVSAAIPAVLAYRRSETAAMLAERNAKEVSKTQEWFAMLKNGNGQDYWQLYGELTSMKNEIEKLKLSFSILEEHYSNHNPDYDE